MSKNPCLTVEKWGEIHETLTDKFIAKFLLSFP